MARGLHACVEVIPVISTDSYKLCILGLTVVYSCNSLSRCQSAATDENSFRAVNHLNVLANQNVTINNPGKTERVH